MGPVTPPEIRMRKPKLREMRKSAQAHTTRNGTTSSTFYFMYSPRLKRTKKEINIFLRAYSPPSPFPYHAGYKDTSVGEKTAPKGLAGFFGGRFVG